MAASLAFDALPGFTASDLEHHSVSILGAPEETVLAVEDGIVCGYVSPANENLTVHPEYRRRGHGRRLFAAGLELAAKSGFHEIRLHVPSNGNAPAFAKAIGLAYRSSLWRLDLAPDTAVPDPSFSDDVLGQTFGDWIPLDRFVELLNVSFASHPSPISFSLGQIQFAHARPEFDPTTVFILTPAGSPEQPIGFVRVGVDPPEDGDLAPVGDLRLVGVLPEWRGRGLGRGLLRWGVADLRRRGAGRIQLAVEAENDLALGLYRRTGFEPVVEWPHWTRPIPSPDPEL
jgi:mycothiol synthase